MATSTRPARRTPRNGSPDPSIFSTPEDPVGIQRRNRYLSDAGAQGRSRAGRDDTGFRQACGDRTSAKTLVETAETAPATLYESIRNCATPAARPAIQAQVAVSPDWFDWPALPDLFPASFPGVKTSRDSFLVSILISTGSRLASADYFDPDLSHEEAARRLPDRVMQPAARFDPQSQSVTRCSSAEAQRSRASFATLIARLTTAGSTGKRRQSCSTRKTRRLHIPHVLQGQPVAWSAANRISATGAVTEPQSDSHASWLVGSCLESWGHMFSRLWLRDDGI